MPSPKICRVFGGTISGIPNSAKPGNSNRLISNEPSAAVTARNSPSPTKTPARGSCLVFLMTPEMRVRPGVDGVTLTVMGFVVSNSPSLATKVKL